MFHQVTEEICPWYRGPSFIQLIDELPSLNRKMDGPFIMPVVDKYKDMGTVLMGKVEAGVTRKGQTLFLMPNRVSIVLFNQARIISFQKFSMELFLNILYFILIYY